MLRKKGASVPTYQSTISLPSSSVEKYASLVHPRVVGSADEFNLWHRRVICSDPICKPVKNAFNQPMRNAQYMQSVRNPVGMKTQPIQGRNAIRCWVTSNQDPTRWDFPSFKVKRLENKDMKAIVLGPLIDLRIHLQHFELLWRCQLWYLGQEKSKLMSNRSDSTRSMWTGEQTCQ